MKFPNPALGVPVEPKKIESNLKLEIRKVNDALEMMVGDTITLNEMVMALFHLDIIYDDELTEEEVEYFKKFLLYAGKRVILAANNHSDKSHHYTDSDLVMLKSSPSRTKEFPHDIGHVIGNIAQGSFNRDNNNNVAPIFLRNEKSDNEAYLLQEYFGYIWSFSANVESKFLILSNLYKSDSFDTFYRSYVIDVYSDLKRVSYNFATIANDDDLKKILKFIFDNRFNADGTKNSRVLFDAFLEFTKNIRSKILALK